MGQQSEFIIGNLYDSIIFNISSHGYKNCIVSSEIKYLPIYQIQNKICQFKSLRWITENIYN